jgi:hypothetical protein
MLRSAMLVWEHVRGAGGRLPLPGVSAVTSLGLLRPQRPVLEVDPDLLTPKMQCEDLKRFYKCLGGVPSHPRRPRSCGRAARHPVGRSLRLLEAQAVEAPVQFALL